MYMASSPRTAATATAALAAGSRVDKKILRFTGSEPPVLYTQPQPDWRGNARIIAGPERDFNFLCSSQREQVGNFIGRSTATTSDQPGNTPRAIISHFALRKLK
jgi:hypothetical protein